MNLSSKFRENKVGGTAGAAVTMFLGLLLLIPDFDQGLVNWSYDLPYIFRPRERPQEVVVVYMDDESHLALRQPPNEGWDRQIHAQLLTRLKEYGATAVAFDILFEGNTTNETALVEAARSHGKVAVGARYVSTSSPVGAFTRLVRPFEALRAVAVHGVSESSYDGEYIRQSFLSLHDTNVLSLAWRVAELTHPTALDYPLQPRWLNYYGPDGTLNWRSYVSVYSNQVPASVFSNKVVFVGAKMHTGYSGGKGTDEFFTPFSRWTGIKSPGVDINATAYLNLIHRDCLLRLVRWKEALLVLGFGLVFGFGLTFLRPLTSATVTAGVMLLVFAAACVIVWHWHVWFAWAIVSMVQLPCAALVAALFNTQKIYREKAAVEARLAAQTAAAKRSPAPPTVMPTPTVVIRQMAQEQFPPPAPHRLTSPAVASAAPEVPPIPDHVLLRKIGVGAYGEVWLGRNVFNKYRAVKIVYRKNFEDDRPYEREFEGIKHFDPFTQKHTGLLSIFHVGRSEEGGYFYSIMELADDCETGQQIDPNTYECHTLGRELKRRRQLPVEQCIDLAMKLTDSLGFLHEHGLIHRDIKPSNIIFVDGKPKLADIGLVTQVGDGHSFVGTRGYLPPEGPGSPAGDVFSLGVVLYEALTGLPNDKFPELPTALAAMPRADQFRRLNQLILKACKADPAKRYASAREMHADLQRLAATKRTFKDLVTPWFGVVADNPQSSSKS